MENDIFQHHVYVSWIIDFQPVLPGCCTETLDLIRLLLNGWCEMDHGITPKASCGLWPQKQG